MPPETEHDTIETDVTSASQCVVLSTHQPSDTDTTHLTLCSLSAPMQNKQRKSADRATFSGTTDGRTDPPLGCTIRMTHMPYVSIRATDARLNEPTHTANGHSHFYTYRTMQQASVHYALPRAMGNIALT